MKVHLAALLLLSACSDEPSGPRPEPPIPDPIGLTACDDPIASAGRTTYFVAIDQPGADNERCDGLAPTDEGNGRCPFRDLTTLRVRQTLFASPTGESGARNVTLVLRAGTYRVAPLVAIEDEPPIPLMISSSAAAPDEAVVVKSFEGETAILDGTCDPAIAGCDSPEDPGRIFQLVQAFGDNIRVQNLRFQNAHKWNLSIDGQNVCVQDNVLTGPHGSDSDSIKAFGGSGPNVVIRRNEFFDGFEQAVDGTNARGWLLQHNAVHDGGGGFGFKFEAQDVFILDNEFSNLSKKEAIALGGTGSASPREYEALRIIAERNHIHDVARHAAQFVYCKDCTFRGNRIERALAGIIMLDPHGSGCRDGAGCLPTTGATVTDNTLRDLRGAENEVGPNMFLAIEPNFVADFTAGGNTYCATSGAEQFYYGQILDLAGWLAATGTDTTSKLVRGTCD